MPQRADTGAIWGLDPTVEFLNHGSYGACPTAVLEQQATLRAELEAEPLRFFGQGFQERLDRAREAISELVGCSPQNLVFTRNATEGVNTVLRSLTFEPGDEILITNHSYNACKNAADFVASRSGATVRVASIAFPFESKEDLTQPILSAVTERTRLVLIDHVTSPTGIVFPVKELAAAIPDHVDILVDGAHAPGMLPLSIESLGVQYYTGNCHKWLCAPKSAALLWVAPERQDEIHPLTISHGLTLPKPGYSRFQIEFDWPGTHDPTPVLALPSAIETLSGIFGSMDGLYTNNRNLLREARGVICEALDVPPPCPEEFLGSLATIPLTDGPQDPEAPGGAATIHHQLFNEHKIEVPIFYWPTPRLHVRISAQAYNQLTQYEILADRLRQLLS